MSDGWRHRTSVRRPGVTLQEPVVFCDNCGSDKEVGDALASGWERVDWYERESETPYGLDFCSQKCYDRFLARYADVKKVVRYRDGEGKQ